MGVVDEHSLITALPWDGDDQNLPGCQSHGQSQPPHTFPSFPGTAQSPSRSATLYCSCADAHERKIKLAVKTCKERSSPKPRNRGSSSTFVHTHHVLLVLDILVVDVVCIDPSGLKTATEKRKKLSRGERQGI